MPQDIFSAMQVGAPYRSYIKTILGKVYVHVFDSFKNDQQGRILIGNPRGKDIEGSIVDVWSEKEDMFFKRMNRRHFETGVIIPFTRPNVAPPKSPNEVTDEELVKILDMKYIGFQHQIKKFTSTVPLFRLLDIAKEQDRSPKYVSYIEGVIAAKQKDEYGTVPVESEEE